MSIRQEVSGIKRGAKFWFDLFWSTFSISAFTFGGGYVIVPLMRKKFVEKLKWVEEKEMLDYVAIAQSAPGPIAINTSILVGFKLAGVPGALITVFGTVLPPLIVISIISLLYTEFRDNVVVNAAMLGMRVGIAAVLIDVVITMSMQVFKEKRVLSVLILVAAFAAAFLLNIHIVVILLVSATVGAADTLYRGRKGAGKA